MSQARFYPFRNGGDPPLQTETPTPTVSFVSAPHYNLINFP